VVIKLLQKETGATLFVKQQNDRTFVPVQSPKRLFDKRLHRFMILPEQKAHPLKKCQLRCITPASSSLSSFSHHRTFAEQTPRRTVSDGSKTSYTGVPATTTTRRQSLSALLFVDEDGFAGGGDEEEAGRASWRLSALQEANGDRQETAAAVVAATTTTRP
jgi:hypothetical protein